MSTIAEPVQAQTTTRQFRDNRHKLKIKIKTLAAEARAIRLEERKCCIRDRKLRARDLPAKWEHHREEMYRHRIDVVRLEARAAQLAYAFLRGKRLRQVEPRVREGYECSQWWALKKAKETVERFGIRSLQPAWTREERAALLEAKNALIQEFDAWAAE